MNRWLMLAVFLFALKAVKKQRKNITVCLLILGRKQSC
nr:MAG TPA: hypothetical protein [Caudoviricetes sp.]